MKSKFISILLLIVCFKVFSQQDSHYAQYMYNMNIVNPAYAGIHNSINIKAFSQQQFARIKGAPQTHTLSIESPLKNSLGGGISFVTDKIGPVTETNFFIDLSYTIKITHEKKIAFGIKTGYTLLNKNLNNLITNDSDIFDNYPEIDNIFNYGFGVLYHTNDYYIGGSLPYFVKGTFLSNKRKGEFNFGQSYFFTGGYVFKTSSGNKIKPSFMYRGRENTIESLDLSLNYLLENGFEMGISYRINDIVSAMINYKIGKRNIFTIGYAYEYYLSSLSQFSAGSHEIMLMFDLKLNDNVKKRWADF